MRELEAKEARDKEEAEDRDYRSELQEWEKNSKIRDRRRY